MGYVGARQAKRHSPQPPLFCWCRGQHLGGSGRAEASQQLGEEFLVRIGAGEKEADTTGVAQDDGADFEDLEPDGGGLGAGQFGADQPDAANGLDEHVSGAGKQESELVCPPSRSAGSVSEESELLLFDPILIRLRLTPSGLSSRQSISLRSVPSRHERSRSCHRAPVHRL